MKHLHTTVYAAITLASLAAALLQPEPLDSAFAQAVLGSPAPYAASASR